MTAAKEIHSFVDEAGDPTLFGSRRGSGPLIGSDGCSILGKLEVDDPEFLASQLGDLRARLLTDPYFAGVPSFCPARGKTAVAFHAKDDLPEVRYQVFRLLQEQGDSLRFDAVIADKRVLVRQELARREVDPSARYDPNSLYDSLVRSLYGKFHRLAVEYHVWIAKRGQKDRNEALLTALGHAEGDFQASFGFARGNPEMWNLRISNPKSAPCLQAVDYFLWAVQRFYEPRRHPSTNETIRENRFLKLIWPQVGELHDLHFGGEEGTFFTSGLQPTEGFRFPSGTEGKIKRGPQI